MLLTVFSAEIPYACGGYPKRLYIVQWHNVEKNKTPPF